MLEPKTRTVIIAGNSHKTALIGGVDTLHGAPSLLPVTGRDRVFGLHGGNAATESYWNTLAAHRAPENCIALLLGGNEHYWFFLLETYPRFDVIPRGLESLPAEENSVILPESLVRAKFMLTRAHIFRAAMSILKSPGTSNIRIALIGSPPPKRHNRRIRDQYGHLYGEYELTAPTKMLKLWHILQGVMRQEAAENEMEFIPVPRAVMADDGFLKAEFEGADHMHANHAYGQVMLDHLERKLLHN